MLQHRITNGSLSGRKQQTAVKQTVDRTKTKSWQNDNNANHRNNSHTWSSVSHVYQFSNEDHNWSKSSTKIFDDVPELELTCEEEMLTEAQLQNYPTQV